MSAASILRIAAFSDGAEGGNPAGVWIGPALPPEAEMQRLAHEVGFSETAFAARQGEDMGMRSRLHAEIPDAPGSSIRVVGTARSLWQYCHEESVTDVNEEIRGKDTLSLWLNNSLRV